MENLNTNTKKSKEESLVSSLSIMPQKERHALIKLLKCKKSEYANTLAKMSTETRCYMIMFFMSLEENISLPTFMAKLIHSKEKDKQNGFCGTCKTKKAG